MTLRFVAAALLFAVALPASAATRRYLVELSTEPGPAHRAEIRAEQDRVAISIQALGGVVISRTDTASNTLTVDLPEEKAPSLASIKGVRKYHVIRRSSGA